MKTNKQHDLMVFCTAAATQTNKYQYNILKWYNMLKPLHGKADFYIISDGDVNRQILDSLSDSNISVIQMQPKLGRMTTKVFPGWKRSYGYAMGIAQQYDYCMHCQNDVIIYNWNKLYKYLYKYGNWSSWCPMYNFPQAAFQIINTPYVKQYMYSRYIEHQQTGESDMFQKVMRSMPFQYPFTSNRLQKGFNNITNLDFTAQSYDEIQTQR